MNTHPPFAPPAGCRWHHRLAGLLPLLFGLTLGNFVYQAFCGMEWITAIERSIYQFSALLCVAITYTPNVICRDCANCEGWEPIKTAPRDGREILVWHENYDCCLARWIAPAEFLSDDEVDKMGEAEAWEAGWFYADFIEGGVLEDAPTYWMPVPSKKYESTWHDGSTVMPNPKR